MIIERNEFIKHYLEKLNHKVEQELREILPERGFFADMVEITDNAIFKLYEYRIGGK